MGETLADIARREISRGAQPRLVVRHTGAGKPHRDKFVVAKLGLFYGKTQALDPGPVSKLIDGVV